MEKKSNGIGIGVGLAALLLAAPFAFAHFGGQPYETGYGMPGMMSWRATDTYLAGPGGAGHGEKDSDFYNQMTQMHNSIFGTNYTAAEFENFHEGMGCH